MQQGRSLGQQEDRGDDWRSGATRTNRPTVGSLSRWLKENRGILGATLREELVLGALAVFAAWKGPWEEALRGFRVLIEENPRDAESRHRFAMALYHRGEWESAIEQWGLAAEADPAYPEAWYGLGMAWSTRANWTSAAVAFTRRSFL